MYKKPPLFPCILYLEKTFGMLPHHSLLKVFLDTCKALEGLVKTIRRININTISNMAEEMDEF